LQIVTRITMNTYKRTMKIKGTNILLRNLSHTMTILRNHINFPTTFCDSVIDPMVELLSFDSDSDVEIIETTPDECHFDNIFASIPAKQMTTNKFKR
jgi:hypothetical protein